MAELSAAQASPVHQLSHIKFRSEPMPTSTSVVVPSFHRLSHWLLLIASSIVPKTLFVFTLVIICAVKLPFSVRVTEFVLILITMHNGFLTSKFFYCCSTCICSNQISFFFSVGVVGVEAPFPLGPNVAIIALGSAFVGGGINAVVTGWVSWEFT